MATLFLEEATPLPKPAAEEVACCQGCGIRDARKFSQRQYRLLGTGEATCRECVQSGVATRGMWLRDLGTVSREQTKRRDGEEKGENSSRSSSVEDANLNGKFLPEEVEGHTSIDKEEGSVTSSELQAQEDLLNQVPYGEIVDYFTGGDRTGMICKCQVCGTSELSDLSRAGSTAGSDDSPEASVGGGDAEKEEGSVISSELQKREDDLLNQAVVDQVVDYFTTGKGRQVCGTLDLSDVSRAGSTVGSDECSEVSLGECDAARCYRCVEEFDLTEDGRGLCGVCAGLHDGWELDRTLVQNNLKFFHTLVRRGDGDILTRSPYWCANFNGDQNWLKIRNGLLSAKCTIPKHFPDMTEMHIYCHNPVELQVQNSNLSYRFDRSQVKQNRKFKWVCPNRETHGTLR